MPKKFLYVGNNAYISSILIKQKTNVMMDYKSFKKILNKKAETRFTIDGIVEYNKDENGEYGYVPKVFKTDYSQYFNRISTISEDRLLGGTMFIEKVGPTTVTLSTIDILGRKFPKRIKLNKIKIKEDV